MARKPYPSEQADRFIIRMPDGLRDRIAQVAKENNRSMNAEIIARLEASFGDAPASQWAPVSEVTQRMVDEIVRRLEASDAIQQRKSRP